MKLNGAALATIRERSGYTLRGFASECGIDRTHYSRMESGERNGTEAQIVTIANVLKVPLPAILCEVAQ